MNIIFPRVYALDHRILKNPIKQIHSLEYSSTGSCAENLDDDLISSVFTSNNSADRVLLRRGNRKPDTNFNKTIECGMEAASEPLDLSRSRWISHPGIYTGDVIKDSPSLIQSVVNSWAKSFSYDLHDEASDTVALRMPQLGAIHAAKAHWSISSNVATIVMPTGTGKTDTMISLLVTERFSKLLVVVPTDALRAQLFNKFLTLGILKHEKSSLLKASAQFPIVCMLRHMPKTADDVDKIFSNSQVIVTTSGIVGRCADYIRDAMAHHCECLFVDEAHHAEANTWKLFKRSFQKKKILQFTATPFREDGQRLDGAIIYKYPLRQAQEHGYFKPIRFEPVIIFDNQRKVDEAIARKAVEELRGSLANGHILMARTQNIQRAREVFMIYSKYPEFNPRELHTGISSEREKDEVRNEILAGKCRIIVCVDMLGEGFDLPELKIAAFHDIRKTLAITLQIAGRFTRNKPGLGEAVFIANTADVIVRDEINSLYARDPDWNILLPQLSDKMIDRQISLQDVIKGFVNIETVNEIITLKNLKMATSAVLYKTTCREWTPDRFRSGMPSWDSIEQKYNIINPDRRILIILTAQKHRLPWADSEDVFDWIWEMITVYWSKDLNVLFINSANNSGDYKVLAQAIAGDDATLIRGQSVFRVFSGINRLRLQSVGLSEQLGRNVSFTGKMGANVGPGVLGPHRARASKSIISGCGFEDGANATAGASKKGKIWSHQRVSIDGLVMWFERVGAKITNEAISPDEVLKGTLETVPVKCRPSKMPCYISWPEDITVTSESMWTIYSIDGSEHSLSTCEIELSSISTDGDILFSVIYGDNAVSVKLEFFESDAGDLDFKYTYTTAATATIAKGLTTTSSDAVDICEYFNTHPPIVWFVDGSSLEGNQYTELKADGTLFNKDDIVDLDWSGTDIQIESQGESKISNSIQYRIISDLKGRGYEVIVNDDDKGEAADIVAFMVSRDKSGVASKMEIELYHCKFSSAPKPGSRVGDFYEVCGQAQKCIKWASNGQKKKDLFTHLMRRDANRTNNARPTRFEVGTIDILHELREESVLAELSFRVFIVQPGLKKSEVTNDVLRLLGVTQNHLWETYEIPLSVIANK